MTGIWELCKFNLQLLSFSLKSDQFELFSVRHLYFGLFCTWIVGIGRWWDDPNAKLLQHLGLGSVAYVFVLALLIWLLVLPLKPKNWSYTHVLTFVSLTSLPALLYAIPVEQFFSMDTAIRVNVAFLAIVALWRVALYMRYLLVSAELHPFQALIVGLLPLCAIVSALVWFNLHSVVFRIMGGLREAEMNEHSGEYLVVVYLTMISIVAIGPLVLAYLGCIIATHWDRISSRFR